MIVLVGPRGVGKTTLGQWMAVQHGWRWQDSDQVICQQMDVASIRDVYQTLGEPAFRQLESDVVKRCLANNLDVLTLGGGALRQAATREILSEHCCVGLVMPAHRLWQRWQDSPHLCTWHTHVQLWSCFKTYWMQRQHEATMIPHLHELDATKPLVAQASCLKALC